MLLHKYEFYILPHFYFGYSPTPIYSIYDVVLEIQIFSLDIMYTNWDKYSKYFIKTGRYTKIFPNWVDFIPEESYLRIFGLEIDWECT